MATQPNSFPQILKLYKACKEAGIFAKMCLETEGGKEIIHFSTVTKFSDPPVAQPTQTCTRKRKSQARMNRDFQRRQRWIEKREREECEKAAEPSHPSNPHAEDGGQARSKAKEPLNRQFPQPPQKVPVPRGSIVVKTIMKSYLPDPRGQKTKEDAQASSTKLTHRDRQPETAGQSGKLPTVSRPVEKQAEDQSKGVWSAEQLKKLERGEQALRWLREEMRLREERRLTQPKYYSIFDKPKTEQRDCPSEKNIAVSTPSRPNLPSHHIPVVKKKESASLSWVSQVIPMALI
jgi:hypothetical protein